MINSTVYLLTCCNLGPEQIMLGVKAGDINTYSWKRLVIIKKIGIDFRFFGVCLVLITEKAMGIHSSTLAWKIPWMEEQGRLQSMGSLSWTWLSDFTFTFHFHILEKEMATHSSILAWRIPGTGEPVGLPPMGSHRVGHDWHNLSAAVLIKKEMTTHSST